MTHSEIIKKIHYNMDLSELRWYKDGDYAATLLLSDFVYFVRAYVKATFSTQEIRELALPVRQAIDALTIPDSFVTEEHIQNVIANSHWVIKSSKCVATVALENYKVQDEPLHYAALMVDGLQALHEAFLKGKLPEDYV